MADVTNAPVPAGTSEFDVPGDMQALADHFGGGDMFYKPTPGDLPTSGNWPGRELYVQSDGTTRKWTGSAWVTIAKTATAPGSIIPTPGAGVTLSDNTLFTRNGFILGDIDWAMSSPLTHGQVVMTFPTDMRPVSEYIVDVVTGPSPSIIIGMAFRPDGAVTGLQPPASRTSGSVKFVVPIPL